jgi:dipeptidyl aminopeptidase/acylaminoacyl peptidase
MVRPLLLAAALLCCVSPAGHALPQARVAGPTAHDLATLVELGAVHGGLALSPDGAYVAVLERRTDFDRNNYDYALVVVPAGGGAPRTLAGAGGFIFQAADGRRSGGPLERDPVWSPDSQWIAFIAEREGRAELWRAHVTSGRSERIAALDGDVTEAVWLADGRLLVGLDPPRAEMSAMDALDERFGYRADERLSPVYSLTRMPSGVRRNVLITHGAVEDITPQTRAALLRVANEAAPVIAPRPNAPQVQSPPLEIRVNVAGEMRRCQADACDRDVRNATTLADGRVAFLRLEGFARGATGVYVWNPTTGEVRRIRATEDRLACIGGEQLYCLRESLWQPRELVAINPESGAVTEMYDPNSSWRRFQEPRIERLDFTDQRNLQSYAHLVYPQGYRAGRRYPLVIVQYRSRGFLRGGTGGEHPIYPLTARGYFVLSVERPEDHLRATQLDHDTFVREQELSGEENRMKLDAIDGFIDVLERRGLIDSERIAITGMSDGSETLYLALLRRRFAAAVASTPPTDRSAWWLQSETFRDRLRRTGGAPPWTNDEAWSNWWAVNSIAEHATAINTPILFNLTHSEALTGLPLYVRMREDHTPAEMFLYPDAYHLKWRPLQVLAAQERAMAWIDFWLRDVELSDPNDPDRNERWRTLRAARQQTAQATP